MKKFLIFTGLFSIFALFVPWCFSRAMAAGITLDPTSVSTTANGQFSVKVNVNAGSEQISGTDAYITFDGSYLRADSVSAGTFFPTVSNNITSSRVYIAGIVDDPATSKTGSGVLATITFTALKEGTVTISVNCDSSKVVKNDVDATNIINCSENGTSAVTIGTGTSSGTSGGTSTGGDAGQPSSLPKSGVFDNLVKWAVPGTVLFLLGIVGRLVVRL